MLAYHGTALIIGVICALLADSRGRSPLGWFFLGFLFNFFALVLLLVLPDENRIRREGEESGLEVKRVREMLKKDRQVADRRFEEATRRLDAHDRAIGIDTRGATVTELAGGPAAEIDAPEPPPVPGVLSVRQSAWYYLDETDEERRPVGPISFARMKEMWEEGAIDGATLVWRDGMQDWAAVEENADLARELRA